MATYGANDIVYPPEFFYFISRSDHYYFALYIHPCGILHIYVCICICICAPAASVISNCNIAVYVWNALLLDLFCQKI